MSSAGEIKCCRKEGDRRIWILGLSVLLVFQLALTWLLRSRESSYKHFEPGEALLSCNWGNLKKITIGRRDLVSKEMKGLVLRRDKQRWLLDGDVPADLKRMQELTVSLKGLKKGFPVLDSQEAPERFRLEGKNLDAFVRFDEAAEGASSLTLNIGSPSGRQSCYVRLDGAKDGNVYSVEMPLKLLSARNRDWISRALPQVNTALIDCIEINDFALKLKDGEWRLLAGGKERHLDPELSSDMVNRIAIFSVESVLEEHVYEKSKDETPCLSYKLCFKDGKTRTYKFFKVNCAGCYGLKLPELEPLLEVSSDYVDVLKELSAEKLLAVQASRKDNKAPSAGSAKR